MSHGHNGTPAAPEWFHDPALERCIGCNQTRDGCEADKRSPSCCGWCSHGLHSLAMPALWEGDDS